MKQPETEDRRARWFKHIKTILGRMDGRGTMIPPEAVSIIEEREGKPLADVILDRLATSRGLDVEDPSAEQSLSKKIDEERETWPLRVRNNRERHDAEVEILSFCDVNRAYYGNAKPEEIALVVNRFYRQGDNSALRQSTERLVVWFAERCGVLNRCE